MSLRYRIWWNKISRVSVKFRSVPIVAVKNIPQRKTVVPYVLGFSLFTWLGFDKQLSAEDELIHTIKHCILFIQNLDYQKAEQLLHVALRQAQQIHHELGITYIYDVMANLALEREQLDKAKQLFISVTQRLMSTGAKEDDLRVVHISAKLARISHLKKEYTTAQLGYDWCLDKLYTAVSREPSEENKKLLAMTEDWYGRLLLDCNKYEQGLKLLVESLNRMKEVSDVDNGHIAIQLNDIGTVCDLLGKSDDSIHYFNEAIELIKPLNMEEMGTMYVNLGRAYMKKKLMDLARKNCGHGWRLGVNAKNEDIKHEAELCFKEIKSMS